MKNEQENSAYKENQGPTPDSQENTPTKKFQFTVAEDTQDCIKNDRPSLTISDTIKLEEDSNSTFELLSEFIAEHNSDESGQFGSPRLKTVDIQKNSSLEISENDEIVNIDVVKMNHSEINHVFNYLMLSPVKPQTCSFKFSPIDKETLQQNNLDIDFQSFKDQYLNEVDRDFKCEYSHKHAQKGHKPARLQSAIDFAIEASITKQARHKIKRKMHHGGVANKKKKVTFVYKDSDKKNIKVICENKNETLDFTMDTPKMTKKHKKHEKNRRNLQVKIKWQEERLNLKITQREKVKKQTQKQINTMKQYILNYPKENSEVTIVKPDHDVTAKKGKYIKTEKSPDKLVQTSLYSFFFTTKP